MAGSAPITVHTYQHMVAAGVLTKYDRVELIDGAMIAMTPIGIRHAAITNRLNKRFVLAVGDTAIVSPGGPVNLGEFSEPQPDLMLLRARADFYAGKIPESPDVLLIIEVSDSSLAFDQGRKRALYAQYGIPEYWVVDVEAQLIHVYREPAPDGFALKLQVAIDGSVAPQALPAVQIQAREVFG